jgi:ATP:ADP antiporter, AAA family
VSRIFKWFGVRAALFVLPVIALGGYVVILALPSLLIIKVAKVLENGTDYSLQNTARQALFLPTSREQKYKAKAAIDTFFVRFGDLASFGLVFAATAWLGLRATGVAAINVVLIAFWLLLVVGIAVQHRRLSKVDRKAG